ncbi:Hypothetical protein ING2D1G_1482 [Peptoniphilus sp. ING2-D1G]|nr:Hypothetical protein ING2D1G_1482 [Peptoniphilus sp. ING2-D1G]
MDILLFAIIFALVVAPIAIFLILSSKTRDSQGKDKLKHSLYLFLFILIVHIFIGMVLGPEFISNMQADEDKLLYYVFIAVYLIILYFTLRAVFKRVHDIKNEAVKRRGTIKKLISNLYEDIYSFYLLVEFDMEEEEFTINEDIYIAITDKLEIPVKRPYPKEIEVSGKRTADLYYYPRTKTYVKCEIINTR